MKIYGIGTDIVNIKRIDKSLKKHGAVFKKKIFSKKEISYCERKKNSSSYFAKRYAAKEAFSKALGTGINKDINLLDKEALREYKCNNSLELGYFSKGIDVIIPYLQYFVGHFLKSRYSLFRHFLQN